MNLPTSPPTDNLYKFAAIGGLVATVTLFMFTILMLDHLWREADTLEADVSVIGAQAETAKRDVESLKRDVDAGLAPGVGLAKGRELQARMGEMEEKTILHGVKGRSLKRRVDGAKWLFWLGSLLCVVAAGLSQWGFRFWYQRLQKPQDDLLRAKVLAGLQKHRQPTTRDEHQAAIAAEALAGPQEDRQKETS